MLEEHILGPGPESSPLSQRLIVIGQYVRACHAVACALEASTTTCIVALQRDVACEHIQEGVSHALALLLDPLWDEVMACQDEALKIEKEAVEAAIPAAC